MMLKIDNTRGVHSCSLYHKSTSLRYCCTPFSLSSYYWWGVESALNIVELRFQNSLTVYIHLPRDHKKCPASFIRTTPPLPPSPIELTPSHILVLSLKLYWESKPQVDLVSLYRIKHLWHESS